MVYELTARGAALDPVLAGLARGEAVLLAGRRDLASRGCWLLQAMAAVAETPLAGIEAVNFVLDGEECHVRVSQGRLAVRDGWRADAPITVRGRAEDLYLLATAPTAAGDDGDPSLDDTHMPLLSQVKLSRPRSITVAPLLVVRK
jgi:hypothetical protein